MIILEDVFRVSAIYILQSGWIYNLDTLVEDLQLLDLLDVLLGQLGVGEI